MKAVIVYDTLYGNTEQIARAIGAALSERMEVRLLLAGDTDAVDLQPLDLLLVGGPTQRHGISPPLHTLFDHLAERSVAGAPAAAFDTRYRQAGWLTGSAAKDIARYLQARGCALLLPPESFFVAGKEGKLAEGEVARAGEWARAILTAMERRVQPAPTT